MRAIHRPRSTLARSALSLALLAALTTAGFAADRRLNPDTTPRSVRAKSRSALKVSGRTWGLYPGATKRLKLELKNRKGFAIMVRRVTAKTKRAAPGCPKTAVKVKTWKGKKRIKAHKAVKIRTKIRMRKSSSDACQGVRFKFKYGGRAVRA